MLGQNLGSPKAVCAFIIAVLWTVTTVTVVIVCVYQAASIQELSERITALEHKHIDATAREVQDQDQEPSRNYLDFKLPGHSLLMAINKSVIEMKDRQSILEIKVEIVKLEQQIILSELAKVHTELLSLHSQVHHPVSPYHNCDIEIHNSTCNQAFNENSFNESCYTQPVSLQAEVS